MTKHTQTFLPFHFQTIDSNIELLLPCEERQQLRIQDIGKDWFGREDKRFSPDVADSEINLLNTLAGESCLVSTPMLEVLFLAEMYQAITDGNYTPLLSIQSSAGTPKRTPSPLGWRVNPTIKSVTLPPHTRIHLQGLEKSWSLKRLVTYMKKTISLTQGLILAAGDVAVWGQEDPQQEPWMLGIQNPWRDNAKLGAVVMPEGALSTYSPLEDWTTGNDSDVELCTVAGQDLVECHVWSRLIGSLGVEEGLSLLAKRSKTCEAVVLSKQDQLHYYGNESSLGQRWIDFQVDHYHHPNRDRVDHLDSLA